MAWVLCAHKHIHITERQSNCLVIQIFIPDDNGYVSPQRRALITVIDWLLLQEMDLVLCLWTTVARVGISVVTLRQARRSLPCLPNLSHIMKTVLWADCFHVQTFLFFLQLPFFLSVHWRQNCITFDETLRGTIMNLYVIKRELFLIQYGRNTLKTILKTNLSN